MGLTMWRIVELCIVLLVLQCRITSQDDPEAYWNDGTAASYRRPNRDWRSYGDCGQPYQSPIDIPFASLWSESSSPPVTFQDYDRANQQIYVSLEKEKISTVRLWIDQPSVTPTVTGGVLYRSPFQFEQAIFHWGSEGNKGSEHKIYGTQYTMEVQFVHYPRDGSKQNVKETLGQDQVLVVSAMLQEYSSYYTNKALEPLIQAVSKLNTNSPVIVPGFKLSSLLPARPTYYFRYDGRLNLPDCPSQVQWLVLRNPIYIGTQQLDKFRRLQESENRLIGDNFREPQDLDARRIYLGLAY